MVAFTTSRPSVALIQVQPLDHLQPPSPHFTVYDHPYISSLHSRVAQPNPERALVSQIPKPFPGGVYGVPEKSSPGNRALQKLRGMQYSFDQDSRCDLQTEPTEAPVTDTGREDYT